MRPYFFLLLIAVLTGCESTGPGSQTHATSVTEQCRIARAKFRICYGSCLSSTPGGFIQAAGQCGNRCSNESMDVQRACR